MSAINYGGLLLIRCDLNLLPTPDHGSGVLLLPRCPLGQQSQLPQTSFNRFTGLPIYESINPSCLLLLDALTDMHHGEFASHSIPSKAS
jgi:hypothetical protein